MAADMTVACRHPDRYTAPDAYATEDQVTALIAAFVTALQPEYVLETGTYHGHTAEAIGRALLENGMGHLDTIEVNPDNARTARDRVAGLPVTVHEVSSTTFTPRQAVDLAFIDEAIPVRATTLKRLRRYVRPGSVILVHDTSDRFSTRARIEKGAWLSFQYLPTLRGLGMAVVP